MKTPTTLLLMFTLMGTLLYCAHPAQAGIDVDGQGNGSTNKRIASNNKPLKKFPPKTVKRVQR
jgi:hypothetical protein